jgi:formamidopyrimidine-DNA glycosylase
LRLHLARGQVVHFRDPRRFGRLIFGNSFDLVHSRPWVQLGPDPLKSGVDPVRLRNVFQRTSRTVKETLMDQTVLAGLGNIQAAEALFLARIHPHRRARSLAPSEVRALARAIVRSLRRTLDQEEAPEWRPRTDAAASTGPVASTDVAVPTAVARRHVAQRRGRFAVSDVTYVEEAGAENPFLVYGHEGEPCPRCRTPIVRTVLGGRATFFCPWCQARTRR